MNDKLQGIFFDRTNLLDLRPRVTPKKRGVNFLDATKVVAPKTTKPGMQRISRRSTNAVASTLRIK